MKTYNPKASKTLRQKLRTSASPAENKIWNIIRNRQIKNLKFFRQYGIADYILDFFYPEIRLCIEIDGGQHNEAINKLKDEIRAKNLENLNVTILRFWNNEILQNIDGVYEKIIQAVDSITPSVSPLP